MENDELIAGLVAKREEAQKTLIALRKQAAAKKDEISKLDQAIHVLAPDMRSARRIATRHARSRHFVSGELSRRCRDAIREADGAGVTAEDIALQAMRDKGIPESNTELREDFTKRLLWTLNRFMLKGDVLKEGWGTAARWKVKEG